MGKVMAQMWAVSHYSLTDFQHTLDVARSGDWKISWRGLFACGMGFALGAGSRFRISGLDLKGFGRNY